MKIGYIDVSAGLAFSEFFKGLGRYLGIMFYQERKKNTLVRRVKEKESLGS